MNSNVYSISTGKRLELQQVAQQPVLPMAVIGKDYDTKSLTQQSQGIAYAPPKKAKKSSLSSYLQDNK